MNSELSLSVLRRLLAKNKQLDQDIYNYAKSMLKAETKIQYKVGVREYYGRVIEIVGSPGRPQVRVENVVTLKRRDIFLGDVTGLVQEN